ncbi:hypothetical protein GCM10010140_64440 [Streptosporangium pseudovulgare]|uniref:Regulatory protein RecX n=2 Tax=Streptosporangium pseudovulgare TaxID=35765 RepID=A0ABQ2RGC7_9ACTN|nr:hypothetical protein GCM10010140_64440 [Streptosporangium pseudovulgare]
MGGDCLPGYGGRMPLTEHPLPANPRDGDDPFWQEVNAAMARARAASGEKDMSRLSREGYERACAALGLVPMSDDECVSPEISGRTHGPPGDGVVATVSKKLASARGWGIIRERRQERAQLRRELERRFPRGMSREQYEEVCAEAGVSPAPDESICRMAADYLAREEFEDLPDLGLFLANFRDMGFRNR